jgi:site-specific recombinase XerD
LSAQLTFLLIFKFKTRGKNTVKNYRLFLDKFGSRFNYRDIQSITSNELLVYLSENTEGQKPATKRFKYTLLKSFFNFINNNTEVHFLIHATHRS